MHTDLHHKAKQNLYEKEYPRNTHFHFRRTPTVQLGKKKLDMVFSDEFSVGYGISMVFSDVFSIGCQMLLPRILQQHPALQLHLAAVASQGGVAPGNHSAVPTQSCEGGGGGAELRDVEELRLYRTAVTCSEAEMDGF